MIIKILLFIMSILFSFSLIALFILWQYYKSICETNSQLKNRVRELLEEREKEEEIEENYKIIKCITEHVKMDKVCCSISIPKEIEIENKDKYVAAIAKDKLWNYAKDRAFYEERENYLERTTVVNLYWFMNTGGKNLGRDSFL